MSKFGEIFGFIRKRERLLKKLYKAQSEVDKIEKKMKELEKPFFDCEVDVEKYRNFFKENHVSFNNGKSKYFVDEIKMSKDYEGNPFYDTVYRFVSYDESGKEVENSTGSLGLRKFLHLLDEPCAEIKRADIK